MVYVHVVYIQRKKDLYVRGFDVNKFVNNLKD